MEYTNIESFIKTCQKLRHPKEGCPWDLKQTNKSLLKYLIEESYEYIQAVELGDPDKMREELGDVFLQVVLHAQVAQDNGLFNIDQVAKTINEKMIKRHPHVFGESSNQISTEEVKKKWDEIKAEDNKDKPFFSDDDLCMPALMSAQKIGAKSAKVNFDWDNHKQVLDKVDEELQEVKDELFDIQNNKKKIKDEIGDLLFSVTQLARHLEIDAEDALRQANKKFINRFSLLEEQVKDKNLDLMKMDIPQLEAEWQEVKAKLRKK